jgi:hypothetical protein
MDRDPIERPARKPRPQAGGRRVALVLALAIVAGDLWLWLGWRSSQADLFHRKAARLDELAAAYRLAGREARTKGDLRLAEDHAAHAERLHGQAAVYRGASMSLRPWSR